MLKFMAKANASGLSAEEVAERLGNIVKNGDFDQQIGAINTHLKVILRRSDSMNSREQVSTVNVTQNFIVPQKLSEDQWKSQAIDIDNEKKK